MRKLIDFINDGDVEFGKVYFLNDFDCNKLRSYIKFYDKDFILKLAEEMDELDQEIAKANKNVYGKNDTLNKKREETVCDFMSSNILSNFKKLFS